MFRFLDHLILRTPALPYSIKLTKDDLIHLIKDPAVNEAIYLASKSLHSAMTKHIWNIEDLQNREDPLLKSIYKYLARMSNRSTPFGIFSGCSVVEWSKNSNLSLSEEFTRRILPDAVLAERLAELTTNLKAEPLYKLNNTIYKVGNEYRFISYKLIDNERLYEVSALEQNVVLERIISTIGSSKFSLNTLVTAFEYNSEDFAQFIKTLISCQFILSIDKPAIGYDFLDLTKDTELAWTALPVLCEFTAVNNDNIGSFVNNYEKIRSGLQETLQYIPSNPFHVTRFNSLHSNSLSVSLQAKISKAAYILNNLARRESNSRLLKFKQDFTAKFDKERVPILNALDPDIGTAYGYPNEGATVLTNGLSSYSTYQPVKELYTDLDIQLYDLLTATQVKGEYTAVITDNFFKTQPISQLPITMAAVFQVYENEKVFVEQIVGTGAIGYFARFASGNDRILNIAKELTDTEAALNHDVLYAEIIHLPEERSLNVMSHPQFWQYEIQYFDDAKGSNVINLQDIDVFVDGDRVVLYSRVHSKEIVPRLSCAYNYNRSEHPVFTLLCDLQCQSPVNNLVFDWGKLSRKHSFLPRLETTDGIILFRATWTFNSKALLGECSKDEFLWKKYFSDFKTKWKIPNEFFMVRGDNELLINTDNEIAMSVFYKEIKNAQWNIVLKECLHSQYQTIITDIENSRYSHQFIAPFINPESSLIRTGKVRPFQLESEKKPISRQFVPGSEWLYLKVFLKPDLSNSILLQLYQLLDEYDIRNLLKQWYYVRYLDGGYHIRIRIQLRYIADFQKLLMLIQESLHPFVESGEISKIQIDTYVREIERYEQNGILLAERLFAFDSIYCCKSRQINEGAPVEHYDLLAFWFMRQYIALLDHSKVVQLIFAEKCFEAFSNEFDCKGLKIHVDKLFRTYSKPLSDIKDEHSEFIALFGDQLNQIADPKFAPVAESFLASIIHMFVNRYFTLNQRLHECLLYGLVIKALKGEIARHR